MNFSVILASRERVSLLDSLLKSLEANTADKVNTEVIVCVDDDDVTTRRYSERLKSSCSFARMVTRPRTRNLNDGYLNWAWRNFATGDYIVICNDDCVFSTPNWDQIALAKLNRFLEDKPDGIVYGWIEDALIERAAGPVTLVRKQKPPIAKPGRGRGFRAKPDPELEGDEATGAA